MKTGLVLLVSLVFLAPFAQARRLYESCVLNGWTENEADKLIHYSVRIQYNPLNDEKPYASSQGIRSIVVQYGHRTVNFPAGAFNDGSRDWGVPSHFGYSTYGKGYILVFFNCGDGAKSYEMEFLLRGGYLVERQLIPAQISELEDTLLRFNRNGNIIYNGPCDRQGKPTGRTR